MFNAMLILGLVVASWAFVYTMAWFLLRLWR